MANERHSARIWMGNGYESKPVCCVSMATAFSHGSDNEGYGSLLHSWGGNKTERLIGIGSDLPPLKYCPWCGFEVEKFDWMKT